MSHAEGPGRRAGQGDRLHVQADLSLDIDGVTARLTGDGGLLTLRTSHPERVWASALGASLPMGGADDPRSVGRIADALADAGLRVDVVGPQGVVVSLGAGVDSRAGRIAAGSAAVGPGSPKAVALTLWRRTARPALTVLGAGALALLGAATWARRRRRR